MSPLFTKARLRLALAVFGAAATVALIAVGAHPARAKGGGGEGLAPLSSVAVPAPPDVTKFIRDNTAAVKLGKALFWDMQTGSDGRTACASCHFSAGTDNRSRNQLNPRGGGFNLSGKGPNAQLARSDFPFHRLADANDATSAVLSDTDNVAGSQGVLPSAFNGIVEGDPVDAQTFAGTDAVFHVGAATVRQTTGRNTPSVINAVFNFRQFWDGRGQNDFNGVNPFGSRDPNARVGQVNPAGGVDQVAVSLSSASLASQATGPPGATVEMSAKGRTLSDVGRKLLSLRPLAGQRVSSGDSVLGPDIASSGDGLRTSYPDLVRSAFQPQWWDSSDRVAGATGRTYTLMQFNFPLYWGLAIQAYESTLVSGQAPVDRFLTGDASALSPEAQQGMGIFAGKGHCDSCHGGAAMTSASAGDVALRGAVSVDEGRLHDTGFFNIGVRPTSTDIGNGSNDPFGHPLSIAGAGGQAVQGSFKAPGLRNVALTAPYFHNGGQLTLRQVVDFYNRGGDFSNPEKSGEIKPLGLSDGEKAALVAFLESLTDPRVRSQSAPFDHPQLFVPAGAQTKPDGSVITDENGRALDCFKDVRETGAGGGEAVPDFPDFTGPPCDSPPALQRLSVNPASDTAAAPSTVSGRSPVRGNEPLVHQQHCRTPQLRGRTLAAARRVLRHAHCTLGSIAGRRGRQRLLIVRQSAAAGHVLPAGWGISVRVARPRHRKAA